MGRLRRVTRFGYRLGTLLGIAVLVLGVFFTQTPWGRQIVLREVLRRVQGAIQGEIVVEGVSSPGLLRGFTLRGVSIRGEDGRPFLVADSLTASLSPRALLNGELIFTPVAVWAPEVYLERLPDQERMNVVAIFAPGPEAGSAPGEAAKSEADSLTPPLEELPDAEDEVGMEREVQAPKEGGRTVAFHRLRIHGGTLHIILPAPPQGLSPERALLEIGPDGTSVLRRLSFREIDLNVSEAVVLSPEQEGELFRIEALSFRGEIWPTPFRVEEIRGEVRRERGRLKASVHRVSLPSSQAQGEVEVGWGGPEGAWVSVEGETGGLALQDLHWLEPKLPRGVARGPFGLELGRQGLILHFPGTDLTLPQGSLRARGGLLFGSTLGLRDLALALNEVDLALVDPWLPGPLPLRGLVSGDLVLAGNPASLAVEGDLTLSRPDSSETTHARVSGVFHLGDTLGVTDLFATVAPLDWGTFADLSPAMTLRGPGALRMEANGYLFEGIDIDAEVTHVPSGMAPSRVTAEGVLQKDDEDLLLDLEGELSPLSFTSLRRFFPGLPLTGEISGPISLRGLLSDLTVETELVTSAGPLSLEARFDARRPADRYSLDSEFQEFLLSNLFPDLPDPTRLTGRILASGRGMSLDSLEGNARIFLRRGEVGALRVDTAALVARVEEGLLHLDALMAETGVGRVNAEGAFGISSSAIPGELTVQLDSESLEDLRPFLMGDVPLILDDLTSFERDLLVVEGVNLDTIPTAAQVAVGGRVRGQGILRGGLDDFSAEGSLSFQDLRFRTDYVESGTFTFTAEALPGDGGRIQGLLRTDSLRVRNLSFRGAEAEVDLGRADGRLRVMAVRGGEEEYRARGSFALDSLGGSAVKLDELTLRFDTVRWNLGGPTSFAWSPQGVQVRDFRLIRPGLVGMRVQADGFLPFRGEGDFRLEIQQLQLERLAQLAQLQDSLAGLLDFRVRITGRAEAPVMEGVFSGDSLRFRQLTLSGLESEFSYQGQRLEGDVWASEGGRQVLAVEGAVPADLRFQPEGPRIPEGPVDLIVAVDSFPAALALVILESLEEVEGTLSGEVRLGGTPRELAPQGELRLAEGSVFFPALGVRYQGVEAGFSLKPDGSVEVDGSLRSRGTARVAGTVTLHPLTNPALDLTVDASDLLAVARRDIQARITGQVEVLQSYRRPRVLGSLTVEEAVLMVEELARSIEVVDLSDPSFMDVVEQEAALHPILQASQNPFLQNLMLSVELDMARGSWLRGRDMNVEMGGDLQVYWDRTERDLALVGDLQAIRGIYTVLGRQFQVQEGEVSFLGTPGVNPNLDIRALNRLRTPEGEELDIVATVGGTLLSPRVSLSSTTSFAIAESDLVSYLIFGRPTYALASGQSQFAEGAAGSLLGAATGAGTNLALGTISSQLGSVVARDFGLDFLAISQGEYGDVFGDLGLRGTVATTQVEIGQYITEDVFAALLWRPLTRPEVTGQTRFAGLRLEWRLADLWTLEGFIEDQFSRSPLFRSGDLAYQVNKVKGFFFWREWGY